MYDSPPPDRGDLLCLFLLWQDVMQGAEVYVICFETQNLQLAAYLKRAHAQKAGATIRDDAEIR